MCASLKSKDKLHRHQGGEIWAFDGNDEEITMAKLLEWEG